MKTHYFDGQKNIDLSTITIERWQELIGQTPTGRINSPAQAWSVNGWANRCVGIRSNAVGSMPWALKRGDTEIATSDEAGDTYPWVDKLPDFLGLTEAALTIHGEAYWFVQRSGSRRILKLQWLAPQTMTPVWNDDGIAYFERQPHEYRRAGSNKHVRRLEVDEVIYFSLPNPLSEIYAAPSPLYTALADVGVLANLNDFASQFFARGAIKATILQIDSNPPRQELEKLEAWWKRTFRGVRSAWETAAVRAGVNPVVIGEGIEALNNRELSDEKREAIATALGIPHTLVLSNASNYATAKTDRLLYYDLTVIPECTLIRNTLQRQLFSPMGLQFEFQPQRLPVYQEDEREASETMRNMSAAGVRPSHTMAILGRDLPEGVTPDDFDAFFIAQYGAEDNATEPAPVALPEPENADAENERRAFRNWLKNNPKRVNRLDDFDAFFITDADKRAIAFDFVYTAEPEIKATRLQMDPGNPEAERNARLGLEASVTDDLAAGLREWLRSVLPEDGEPEIEQIAQALEERSIVFRDVLQRALVQSADLGVSVADQQLGAVGLGFNYELANADAREWAARYTDDVLAQLNTTNTRIVGEAVARWIDNSEPIETLIAELEGYFDRTRAERIARTEVTRAYAEGALAGYRDSGVVNRIEWRTSNDERVCPICGPLGGHQMDENGNVQESNLDDIAGLQSGLQVVSFALGSETFGPPPAHPNCRCWIVPVIDV